VTIDHTDGTERALEKALLFNVIASIAKLLSAAWDNRQAWVAETTATRTADGSKADGGYEIRISIAPVPAEFARFVVHPVNPETVPPTACAAD